MDRLQETQAPARGSGVSLSICLHLCLRCAISIKLHKVRQELLEWGELLCGGKGRVWQIQEAEPMAVGGARTRSHTVRQSVLAATVGGRQQQ